MEVQACERIFGVADPKVEHFAQVTDEMTRLYEKKNHDYGDVFSKMHKEFGLTHAVIRLTDKLNRLKTLIKSDALVDESMRDTLIDLACYAVMTIMEVDDAESTG